MVAAYRGTTFFDRRHDLLNDRSRLPLPFNAPVRLKRCQAPVACRGDAMRSARGVAAGIRGYTARVAQCAGAHGR